MSGEPPTRSATCTASLRAPTLRFVERPGTRHRVKDHPLVEVGEFTLNRDPGNCFADVDRAAFSPADLAPGISHSSDKMLQGRLFACGNAARHRAGVYHHPDRFDFRADHESGSSTTPPA